MPSGTPRGTVASSSMMGGWTPNKFLRLALWLDASNPASLAQNATGTPVDSWNDLTLYGRHMTAAGAERPTTVLNGLNGRSYVEFNGGGQKLQRPAFISNKTDYLLTGVALTVAGSAKRCWIGLGMNSHLAASHQNDSAAQWFGALWGAIAWVDYSNPAMLNAWGSQSIAATAGAVACWKNGVQQGGTSSTVPNTATGNMFIGGDDYASLTCRVAEIVVVEGTWTTEELRLLHLYYQSKWGLP